MWSVLVVWRESGRGVGRCVRGQGGERGVLCGFVWREGEKVGERVG